jgi:hypothetical protein
VAVIKLIQSREEDNEESIGNNCRLYVVKWLWTNLIKN